MVFSSCKNEHGGLYFSLHYFGVQIIAFKLEKFEKKHIREKRYSKKRARSPLLDIANYDLLKQTEGTFRVSVV